jgi:hypothetical protein
VDESAAIDIEALNIAIIIFFMTASCGQLLPWLNYVSDHLPIQCYRNQGS